MIEIYDKSTCTGCTACAEICPKHCISMVEDEEGFKYPKVNSELCNACRLCEQICPVKNQPQVEEPKAAYVVQNISEELRMNSTSGGAVSALAEYVLSRNGIVIGAEFNHNLQVVHSMAYTVEELKKFQGSKYVQSDLGHIFSEIRKSLRDNVCILFCGMPCQVAGLKSFLQKEYDNLITVDLVCHGVPSPGLFKDYINYLENKHRKQVKNVVFRDKTYGYSSSNMKIYFTDGKTRDCRNDVKTFNRMMFKGLSIRPSCYSCAFKTKGRVSDFTLFDCTMVGTFAKDLDDDKGTTNVLIQSVKGISVFHDASVQKLLRNRKVDVDSIIRTEGTMLLMSAQASPLRDQFMQKRQQMSYQKLANQYAPATVKMMIGNIIKPLLNHFVFLGKFILNKNKQNSIKKYQKRYGKDKV